MEGIPRTPDGDPHFVSGPRYTHRHRPYVQSAPDLLVRADDRRAMRSPSALREVPSA
jgi:hypothetical protein